MKKEKYSDHLIYFLEKTTPYERLVWLKKAFEFWKLLNYNKTKKDKFNKKIYGKLTK